MSGQCRLAIRRGSSRRDESPQGQKFLGRLLFMVDQRISECTVAFENCSTRARSHGHVFLRSHTLHRSGSTRRICRVKALLEQMVARCNTPSSQLGIVWLDEQGNSVSGVRTKKQLREEANSQAVGGLTSLHVSIKQLLGAKATDSVLRQVVDGILSDNWQQAEQALTTIGQGVVLQKY